MIYELRIYELKPGAVPEFLAVMEKLVGHLERHGVKPLGLWVSEFGTLNEVTHLYAFDDVGQRMERLARWKADMDPEKVALQLEARGTMVRQTAKLMSPAAFSGMK